MLLALMLIGGLLLVLAGAEALVRGAGRMALATGLSPLVVGLTVVAFGTSAPELAISLDAALSGTPAIALGNVVGSNIANILLVLGLSAVLAPLAVQRQLVRLDVPVMIAASLAVIALALDGNIGRLDGALLFAGALAYTALRVHLGRRSSGTPATGEYAAKRPPLSSVRNVGLFVAGLAMLVLGAHWLVAAAVRVATALGVGELVVGLTIVAVGTSLPEIATSITAALRGQREMAVGNVVGSNVFNLLAVIGASALAAPRGIAVSPAALRFDLPVMAAVAIASLPILSNRHRIARWEGALFLGFYAAYVAYLLLDATQHAALPAFSGVMMLFVLPLTAVTLVVIAVRSWRRQDPY